MGLTGGHGVSCSPTTLQDFDIGDFGLGGSGCLAGSAGPAPISSMEHDLVQPEVVLWPPNDANADVIARLSMKASPCSHGHVVFLPSITPCTIGRLSLPPAGAAVQIFNLEPDQIHPVVRAELQEMVGMGPMLLEGSIRAGCVHLAVNILLVSRSSA